MKVPVVTGPSVGARVSPLSYSNAGKSAPSFRGLTDGIGEAGRIMLELEAKARAEKEARQDKTKRFKALTDFAEFEGTVQNRRDTFFKQARPDQDNVNEMIDQDFENIKSKFFETLPPDLQEEFAPRVEAVRNSNRALADQFQFNLQTAFFNGKIDQSHDKAKIALQQNASFENLARWQERMRELIETSDLTPVDKQARLDLMNKELQTLMYKEEVKKGNTDRPGNEKVAPGSPGALIISAAKELGIAGLGDMSPEALLAMVISYETSGTFSPSIKGGKDGLYEGLIQFGPAERAKYGVSRDDSFEEQIGKVVAFLKDRGFKPGMTVYDLYSTINAGSPGLYDRSDRPGYTVRRHVDEMLQSGHAVKGAKLVGGQIEIDGIEDDPRFGAVTYEDRIAARRDAEVARAQQRQDELAQESAAYISAYNKLLTDMNDRKAGAAELEEFRLANPGMDYDHINKAQTILAEQNKAVVDLQTAQTFLSSGMPFDPTSTEHKKYLNLLTGKDGLAAVANGDQGYVLNTLMPLIERAGMVPDDIAGTLIGMTRQPDSKKALFALNTLAEIRDSNERAYDALPDEVTRDVDLWVSAKDYMDPKTLMETIRGAPSQELRQAQAVLRKEAQEKLKNANAPDHVSFDKVIDAFDEWTSTPDVAGMGTAREVLRGEFAGLFEYEYTRDGNAAAATERAVKQLKRHWGVTGVGGSRTIMKFPPEKAYRAVMGDHTWIDTQVRTELTIPKGQPFTLVADKQTGQEFGKRQTPSYMVVVNEDGVPKVKLNKAGKPYRIAFEVPEELKTQEKAVFDYEHQKKVDQLNTDELLSPYRRARGMDPIHLAPPAVKEQIRQQQFRLQELYNKAYPHKPISMNRNRSKIAE